MSTTKTTIGTGRHTDRSTFIKNLTMFNNLSKFMEQYFNYKPKIKWQRLPGLKLQAYTDDVAPRGYERGLNESDMDPVQAWTTECNCGKRMSFNVWKFKNEKHITMFLMKWSS